MWKGDVASRRWQLSDTYVRLSMDETWIVEG